MRWDRERAGCLFLQAQFSAEHLRHEALACALGCQDSPDSLLGDGSASLPLGGCQGVGSSKRDFLAFPEPVVCQNSAD